jgi:lecithin:cholesterol acyltransferase
MASKKKLGDVVVLLPGITGSVLAKDGKEVWAPTAGAALGGLVSLGDSVRDLALDGDSPTAEDLGDGVTAPRLVPDVHLFPGLWKIDGYSKTVDSLLKVFDLTRGKNFFEFPYDWRRDNRAHAHRLQRQSAGWLKVWRESSGNKDAKLILVGHSMGGLISRYFVECLGGWRDTRLLLTFGTPYRGSLKALGTLANGMEKGIGPFSVDLSSFARSLTSIYQLLPIYPCYDSGGPQLARVTETAIPNVDAARAKAARAFHDEIIDAQAANARDAAYGYTIRPIVGTFQPTAQSAKLAGKKVELIDAYEGKDQDGDGTVPRVSSTPIELEEEKGAMYAAERHASLQTNDAVLTQLDGILSGLDLDLNVYRALPPARVGLDIDDVYGADEEVVVRAHPDREPPLALSATIAPADSSAAPDKRVRLRPAAHDWYEGSAGMLTPGVYRVTVNGANGFGPVTDVFLVAGAADPARPGGGRRR